ncbi:uncharacterized protein LOC107710250 [Sinocyclocheilus rhinocerous]|uniref:uncharacterized protein LOC107710250 n=1 Tax=Sinocyclocheilus rhinocerous TaxID=307959 RepID=UPI0007B7EF0D|nr:PREDICTED: uncharacterized protein LOC107710250 [Sinocyclocheilus rhinocerous]
MLKCFTILKIMRLQLYLLIWCRAAETLTDQLTDLGQNVTINCDFDVKEVNWLLLKLPDPPVLILRTFSPARYYNNRFRHKYSVQCKPHLFINNVTIDELGLYYCLTTDAPPQYSNGTSLHITEPGAEIQNQNQTQWQTLTLIFVVLNGVLIIVIIGVLKVFVYGSKRTRDSAERFQNTNLQQPQVTALQQEDPNQVLYAPVDLPTQCQRFQSRQVNSTYALLELPKSRTLKHK